jgi:hypothetical protein
VRVRFASCNDLAKRSVQKLTILLTVLLWLSASAAGQTRGPDRASIESKLSQETSFVPQSASALEQLTEVAQHYQVPMGIEWIGQLDVRIPKPLYPSRRTVRSLIDTILQQVPGYRARVVNGVLNIARGGYYRYSKEFSHKIEAKTVPGKTAKAISVIAAINAARPFRR